MSFFWNPSCMRTNEGSSSSRGIEPLLLRVLGLASTFYKTTTPGQPRESSAVFTIKPIAAAGQAGTAVVAGSVWDVAVDIRRSSPTFSEWVGVELSAANHKQLWIPPGFAHGFIALSDPSDVIYKVTDYYSPEHDRAIRWDDKDIGIAWPVEGVPLLSDKDANAPYLRDADLFA